MPSVYKGACRRTQAQRINALTPKGSNQRKRERQSPFKRMTEQRGRAMVDAQRTGKSQKGDDHNDKEADGLCLKGSRAESKWVSARDAQISRAARGPHSERARAHRHQRRRHRRRQGLRGVVLVEALPGVAGEGDGGLARLPVSIKRTARVAQARSAGTHAHPRRYEHQLAVSPSRATMAPGCNPSRCTAIPLRLK